MITATRRWLRRNRNTLLIGAGVVAGGYVAGQYVLGKIREARERMTEDRTSKENLRRRFEQNQEDCTYTVLALLPTIREEIIGALPVEQITEQLQQERQERLRRLGASEAASSELPSGPPSVADDSVSLQSSSYVHASQMMSATGDGSSSSSRSKKSKAQLWQEMKIHSIARALTLIYTVSLLTLLTRIQLNLLGRRTYLSSVVAMASPLPAMEDSKISLENRDDDNYENMYGNDFETNRKYLTFSWWLLHRGSRQIMERVLAVVKDVFGGVNIREDLSIERLSSLLMQVRRQIEGSSEEERRNKQWLSDLLPPREDELFVIRQSTMSDSEDLASPEAHNDDDPMDESAVNIESVGGSLRRLLDETSDLIDSPTFTHVLSRMLDASFSHLVDYRIATEAYSATGAPAPGTGLEEPRVTEVVDKKCKLAHLLPVFCKQAHVITTGAADFEAMGGITAQVPLQNEYVGAMDHVPELGAFAAVIYSSNFEYEVQESASTTAPQSEAHPSPPAQAKDPEIRYVPRSTPQAPEAAPQIPETTSQVPETEPQEVVATSLEESSVVVPPEMAAEGVGATSNDGFEAAWKNAVSEDGQNSSS